jgi:hypothetical protein
VNSFDKDFSSRLSPLHQNQTLIDCMIQLNSDVVDDQDHLSNLIVYQDPIEEKLPFIIVKIDSNYVVCDISIPFNYDGSQT